MKAKPFIVFCPQLNKLYLIENAYGLDFKTTMFILNLGLKSKYTLEYIGEL